MNHYYQDDHCTIYNCDLRDILQQLEPVDLVFTSPPYWKQRKYELDSIDWIDVVAKSLPKIQDKGDTQILINLGLVHSEGEVFPYWNYLIDEMKLKDWRWYGQYVWNQGDGLPGEFNGRLAPNFEFIFHFNKKKNLLNKTELCKSYGRKNDNTKTFSGRDGYINSFASGNETVGKYKISDSIISINRQLDRSGIETAHPAVFPLGFAKKIIQIWPNKTILDPFMGSGTTLRAAKDLGRRCIGIEVSEKYCEIAAERLKQEVLDL